MRLNGLCEAAAAADRSHPSCELLWCFFDSNLLVNKVHFGLCVSPRSSLRPPPGSVWLLYPLFLGHVGVTSLRLTTMKWLASVRAVLAGGSRSAPVTPAASPNIPSKTDLHAKEVSCKQNPNRMLDLRSRMFMVNWRDVYWFWLFSLQLHCCMNWWNSFFLVCLLAWGFPNQFCQLNAVFMRLTRLLVFSWIAFSFFFFSFLWSV